MTTVDDLVVSTNNISLSSNPKELIPKSTPAPLQPLQQPRQYIQNETKQRYSFENAMYMASIIPMVFLTWIQFTLNVLILAGMIFGAWKIGCILSTDLDKHLDKQAHVMLTDIVQCSRDYVRNGCGVPDTAPALEKMCDTWKICMEQDTSLIMKSTETAVVLAQILNRFFDNLSNRTIYCSASILAGTVIFSNMLLSWARIKGTPLRKSNAMIKKD